MEELIKSLKHQLFIIENNFANATEDQLKYKTSPEKWSKKEVLGHLIDSAQNNIRRIVVGQYEDNENIVYEQNIWVNASNYQRYNTKDLVDLFVLLNKHFCILLENLPKEKYNTKTDWGKITPELVSLEYVANDYLKHLNHHIHQMFSQNYTQKFAELK